MDSSWPTRSSATSHFHVVKADNITAERMIESHFRQPGSYSPITYNLIGKNRETIGMLTLGLEETR